MTRGHQAVVAGGIAVVLGCAAGAQQEIAQEEWPGSFIPPEAVVLFDGADTSHWKKADGRGEIGWAIEDGAMTVVPGSGSICTKDAYGDFILYIEFMTPRLPDDVRGQGRGNSGIYLQRRYEVQILDSWGLDPAVDGCGAIYGRRAPDVNACNEPGQWQYYLISFTAPRWDDQDRKLRNARITVHQNGRIIHDNVEIPGKTGLGQTEERGPGPILLQDHGNRVGFRTIWILPGETGWEGPEASGFVPLFDGRTLDGWERRNGKAEYRAEDRQIVGETRPNQPNSFLCTKEHYSDFMLEFEFKVDPELNSGVQIRSNASPEYQNGRVHGYQVEIDAKPRAWTAGIYDEAGRGWLADLSANPVGRAAFKQNAWNRIRVVADGEQFRTYLNGVPAAALTDGEVASGFIGLQVHGIGDREDRWRVRWRDLRLRVLD